MSLPGGWELVLVVLVIMVLFGAKRLPEASRSLGRSLRIFKAETRGLHDDDTRDYDSRDADRASYDRQINAAAAPPPAMTPPPMAPPTVSPPSMTPPSMTPPSMTPPPMTPPPVSSDTSDPAQPRQP